MTVGPPAPTADKSVGRSGKQGFMRPAGDTGRPLRNSADAEALFAPIFANLSIEELHVAHLDADGHVITISRRSDACSDTVALPIAAIVREAVALGAHALVLAHNHPRGDPTPSQADKISTRRLADAARGLDIRLIDHLVFAAGQCLSFRAIGLL